MLALFKTLVATLFLLQVAMAAPASTEYLSPGWSGHERRSTMDTHITYNFTAASTAAAGCASQCSLFSIYNATCGSTLYVPECKMCSTDGLNAYVQCSNCMVASSAKVNHDALASTLSTMERVCQSYTRTALPTLALNVNVTSSTTSSAFSLLRLPSRGAAAVAVTLVLAFVAF